MGINKTENNELTARQTDKTNRQTDKTNRQTDKQTNRQTSTYETGCNTRYGR